MQSWVITGGAASGKTSFAKLLEDLCHGRAARFSSDDVVRNLLENDVKTAGLIKTAFGAKVLQPAGQVDRNELRKVVFEDPKARKKLEEILHPEVREAFLTQQREHQNSGKTELFIAEVPLFYETGGEYPVDMAILVAVPAALQVQRMVETRNLTPDEARRILDAQLPLASKLQRADKVVWNDGAPSLLKLQAKILLQHLSLQNAKR